MDIVFQDGAMETWTADVLITFLSDGCDIVPANGLLDNLCPWLPIAPALRDVRTKKNALHMVHGHPDGRIKRVLFVGLGKKEDISLPAIAEGLAQAIRSCRSLALRTILIPIELFDTLPFGRTRLIEECVVAAECAAYDSGLYKKEPGEIKPESLTFAAAHNDDFSKDTLHAAGKRGQVSAKAALLARTLANTPANFLSPTLFAERAVSCAKELGLSVTVLDEDEMQREGMHALLAVGKGSTNPPRLIVLEHAGPGDPIVLIGKGICFDSGGISLKPAAKMHEMKSDMSGAAAVLACMEAVAEEKLPLHVIGILACAENMPDGGAVKPGDVVYALNGDSVEIVNTDAEGRLVLCDAISYAKKHGSPRALVDIATLTGACAVALGSEIAGLFTNSESLATALLSAGETCGEHLWRMPLWQGYRKQLKSEIADICHTGPRLGGAINAALFLEHFAGETPFAHIDMAGVDWAEKSSGLCPKGATGFGARVLLEFLRGGAV